MDAPTDDAGATGLRALPARFARRLPRTYAVLCTALSKTLRDGYIHAGNIAYLSVVTLLPLSILITAVTAAFGQTEAGQAAIDGVLRALPDNIAALFAPVISEVVEARTGNLLWIGGIVALWTVTTFIETLRDLIHRAYEEPLHRNFLQYRIRSIAGTLVAMLLVTVAFLSQFIMVFATRLVRLFLPYQMELPGWLDMSQIVTPIFIFLALWALFKILAPKGYKGALGWPGALITTLAWIAGSLLLGPAFGQLGHMSLTYGALSGMMIALLFFYAVGFALVLGAELNAALAKHDVPS